MIYSLTNRLSDSILNTTFCCLYLLFRVQGSNPANIYSFKVNNRNTKMKYEICSKLTINAPECGSNSGVFILTFEHISHLFLVFLSLTLNKGPGLRKSF